MKDREKEEYTSGILREKNPSAERFFEQKDVEGSVGVVLLKGARVGACVGENGRSRYRPKECPSVSGREQRWYRELSSFYGRRLLFFYGVSRWILHYKNKYSKEKTEAGGKKS